MALYGAFTSSMMSMMSQSTALDTIGSNIANVNTGGYKKTETRFATVLSKSINTTSDLSGVKPNNLQRIDSQGTVVSTSRNLDAAILGHGFFILNSEADGSGETLYTRDGSFETKNGDAITVTADDGVSQITSNEAYLVDKNGNYVMGWSPETDGTFNASSQLSALRVDSYAFQDAGIATTENTLDLNIPADDASGSTHSYNIQVYDSTGTARTITLGFEKQTTNNTWTVTADSSGSTSMAPVTLNFDGDGQLVSPTSLNLNFSWANGETVSSALDVSAVTQYAGAFTPHNYWQNGYGSGQLREFTFDATGNIQGQFTNSQVRPIYRLGLAVFANPDGLETVSGNMFKESEFSGSANVVSAGENTYASISGNAVEISNVDIADEFTKMIVTQQAYNSSATVFRTVDEMTTVARDLKR